MSESLLTIITPTHNRVRLLMRLYESLRGQQAQNFVWSIVDDASTDSTTEVVAGFDQSVFPISYVKLPHGGKHRSINYAVDKVATPLVFIVDDDDWLPAMATGTIEEYYHAYPPDDKICGYSFLRGYSDSHVNTKPYKEHVTRASYVQARYNRSILKNVIGDCAEVFLSKTIKQFPFPEFPDEYFYHEDGVWVRMSKYFDMWFVNEIIYISEYLEDGLTKSGHKNKLVSPKGMMDRSEVFLTTSEKVNIITLCRMQLLWNVYGIVQGMDLRKLCGIATHRLLMIVFWLPAKLFAYQWSRGKR